MQGQAQRDWIAVWVPADFLMRWRAFGAGMTSVVGWTSPTAQASQGTSYRRRPVPRRGAANSSVVMIARRAACAANPFSPFLHPCGARLRRDEKVRMRGKKLAPCLLLPLTACRRHGSAMTLSPLAGRGRRRAVLFALALSASLQSRSIPVGGEMQHE